jgi:hypothetical protein
MPDEGLTAFWENLRNELRYEADVDGAQAMLADVFTRRMITAMVEDGELEEEAIQAYHVDESVRPAIEVAGYSLQDSDTLNLVTAIFHGTEPEAVTPAEVRRAVKRARAFWQRCRDRPYHDDLEESGDAWDMALAIRRAAPEIRRVRTFVATDGLARIEYLDSETEDNVEYQQSIWDLRRLWRMESTGRRGEPIEIDFTSRFGKPLPALPAPDQSAEYRVLMTVIPGDWLANIYEEYGSRLLERNVRSFLQFTGKVNKGMRDTVRDEPGRFLAYNNGISATASSVELVRLPDGGHGIARILDLQIVNGGQTTASLHRSWRTGLGDVSAVYVQAKITEVRGNLLDELVPRISEYANSQNKIQIADLSSNVPFHIELESLSRNTWAPATAETARQTKWFYERARGQYSDALNRAPSRTEFQKMHPPRQRFSKVELATYENTLAMEPHEVSRGAQKNFLRFMLRVGSGEPALRPDITYLQHAVAKAILFRRAEKIVGAEAFGGYRRNIVAYALARLAHATGQRLDLGAVWSSQATSPAIDEAIENLAHIAFGVLTDPNRPAANVTEWAKREECWNRMRAVDWRPPRSLRAELVDDLSEAGASDPRLNDANGSSAKEPGDNGLETATGDTFLALEEWGKQTTSLTPFQRSLARRIGVVLKEGRELNSRQRPQAAALLREALDRGFVEP